MSMFSFSLKFGKKAIIFLNRDKIFSFVPLEDWGTFSKIMPDAKILKSSYFCAKMLVVLKKLLKIQF